MHSFGVRGCPQKFVFFVEHKGCTTWFQKGCTALEKRFQDIVRIVHIVSQSVGVAQGWPWHALYLFPKPF